VGYGDDEEKLIKACFVMRRRLWWMAVFECGVSNCRAREKVRKWMGEGWLFMLAAR
jgi:hypothetical protein